MAETEYIAWWCNRSFSNEGGRHRVQRANERTRLAVTLVNPDASSDDGHNLQTMLDACDMLEFSCDVMHSEAGESARKEIRGLYLSVLSGKNNCDTAPRRHTTWHTREVHLGLHGPPPSHE